MQGEVEVFRGERATCPGLRHVLDVGEDVRAQPVATGEARELSYERRVAKCISRNAAIDVCVQARVQIKRRTSF